MGIIQVLDQETINQIAAGEVVERPASVVKELVENSIDADSSAITVEIKGGGIDFIRITDNGQGIEKSQIKTAFLRHATSKIKAAKDLETVASLGFRGEALSSICAVSQVELITKTDEEISGIRYLIEGGKETLYEEIGCPAGTTLVIRNLFYNTPARRKFLKSKMTEAGYVEMFMQRLAMSHPEISFKFIMDNKNKIATSGNGNLKDVIYQIYGRDIALNLLEVHGEKDGILVEGYIGKPVISRGNRNYENYYVNKRYLKNPVIAKAIEEGYKGHAMIHKFPFAVLMITMDPHMFDANVHPAKMEMRFHRNEELYEVIVKAVKDGFVKKDLIPKVAPGKDSADKKPEVPVLPEPFEHTRKRIENRFSNLSPERKWEIEEQKRKDQILEADRAKEQENKETAPKKSAIEERIERLKLSGESEVKSAIDRLMPTPSVPEKEDLKEVLKEPEHYGKQMSFAEDPLLSKEARPRHRIIGQVFQTYWMVEYEEKLFFVDQHAAHEKVMYERFKNELDHRNIDSQMIAPPVILTFSLKEKEKYLMCRDGFANLGYQIEEFGGDEYCIRAVPSNLIDVDQQELFIELLDQIDENTGKMNMEIVTDRLATMACKAAVKGNQTMSFQEMDALMDELLALENPYQCPHGRPTIISMSKYEIEKKFKRT